MSQTIALMDGKYKLQLAGRRRRKQIPVDGARPPSDIHLGEIAELKAGDKPKRWPATARRPDRQQRAGSAIITTKFEPVRTTALRAAAIGQTLSQSWSGNRRISSDRPACLSGQPCVPRTTTAWQNGSCKNGLLGQTRECRDGHQG